MFFTSFEFAIFFGVVLALNWRLKAAARLYPPFLLLANLTFYGLGAPRFLPLLFIVTLANWSTVAVLARENRPGWRKFCLGLNVAFGLTVLFFFKYYEFSLNLMERLGLAAGLLARFKLPELVYPIGLSFFTFQGLALAIDHYRHPEWPTPDFLDALNFISFFPTVLSGPIQRPAHFIPQMHTAKYDPDNFNLAVVLILSGLFKKVALSSYVSENIVRQVFQVPEVFSAPGIWAGIYGYSAQIYLDFSGYSDLALGIGLLLGYNVGVNFDAPYLATNLRDFWRRWHISLSSWLRDYLYIPLGGNRRGLKPLNLFLTQILGGLWHGAHLRYLLWGALHGFGLIVSHFFHDRRRRDERAPGGVGLKPWQRRPARFQAWRKLGGFLVTFNFVSLGWILFRAEDSARAWEIVKAAVDFRHPGSGAPPLVWGVIGLTLLMQLIGVYLREFLLKLQGRFSGPGLALWCAFWVVIILKLGPAGVLPFIYFQY
ncbi:MAG: MBOAT family protein [Candidatus Adiutrix sp.]|jgi:D-alanyl-lipoteichoic acid acyltransferase DltB (MBOAT superfamily)|nr:MBOAT family protein [Candidatus Adiutrix sp.]